MIIARAPAADQAIADYFDSNGHSGVAGLVRVVRRPRAFLAVLKAIRTLPVLEARIGDSGEGRLVRTSLLRANRLARLMICGTTAVLELPTRRGEFVLGSSASKRSLRTRVHRAERLGLCCEAVDDADRRRSLLEVTDRYELTHPRASYRGTTPRTTHLLERDVWLVASAADGRPLLVAIPAVDGQWAVLHHFRTVENSVESSLARYWMSAVLVDELVDRGVRYLADPLSPIGLQPGLRQFQRQLGYRYARVRVRRAV